MDLKGRKLGTILIELGLIDADQEKAALEYAAQWGIPFGRACVKMGFIDEELVVRALAVQIGAPSVSLAGIEVPDAALAVLPRKYAEKHRAVPLSLLAPVVGSRKGTLVIAVSRAKDFTVMDELQAVTGHKLSLVIASEREIDEALFKFYGVEIEAHTRASHMVDFEHATQLDPGDGNLIRDPHELAMEFLPTVDIPPHHRR